MDQVFRFIAFLVGSHVIVGSAIVLLAALALPRLKTNAATRHNVWLAVLILLVMMPGLAVFSTPQDASPPINSAAQYSQEPEFFGEAYPEQSAQSHSQSPDGLVAGAGRQPQAGEPVLVWIETTRQGFAQLPWHWIGAALSLVIALGIVLRFALFCRSYLNLRRLIRRSRKVPWEGHEPIRELLKLIGVRKSPLLTHSAEIRTPLTSGIVRHWIMLPSALVGQSPPTRDLEQVLLHELAHIKRRDPLIASLQALVAVFLFWHPAVLFVNRQIRFERELAADDWVLSCGERSDRKEARAYAHSLLQIAQSLRTNVETSHSVACVHSSQGLQARIRILLDKKTNHSTNPQIFYSAAFSSLLALALVVTVPLWPTVPQLVKEEAKGLASSGKDLSATGQTETLNSGLGRAEQSASVEDSNSLDNGNNRTSALALVAAEESSTQESNQVFPNRSQLAVTPQSNQPNTTERSSSGREQAIDASVDLDRDSRFAIEDAERGPNEGRDSKLEEATESLAFVEPLALAKEQLIQPIPAALEVPVMSETSATVVQDNVAFTQPEADSVERPFASEEVTEEPLNFVTALLSSAELAASGQTQAGAAATLQSSAVAQSRESERVGAGSSTGEEKEVIIIDDLSRSELVREIVKVEDEYYRVFNAFTKHKELRVECGDYLPPASFIQRRYCEPRFITAARSESIYQTFVHESYPQGSEGLMPNMMKQFEHFTSETNSLIRRSSYFRELNRALRQLKGRLEELS